MGAHNRISCSSAVYVLVCSLGTVVFTAVTFGSVLIAGYEPSESSLSVTSSEFTPVMVQGGINGAPNATEGAYVLKCEWTNQPDGKIEFKHTGVNFDLAGYSWLLIDIFITPDLFNGLGNSVIGIWDSTWIPNWNQIISMPPYPNQWYTLAIDISGNNQTGLSQIQAFVIDYMSVTGGAVYFDNLRLDNHIPLYRPAENPAETEQGLRYRYFTGQWSKLPEFEILTPAEKGFIHNFDINSAPASVNFGYSFTGFIEIPQRGTYTFYTNSDDGSELYIGSNLVVDNNGSHSSVESWGLINLEKGKHAVTVNYFNNTAGGKLTVSYSGPSIAKTPISDNVLFREIQQGDNNDDFKVNLYDFALIGQKWLTTYSWPDLELLTHNWLEGNRHLEIKDGWLYIDGEKFFVKGMGYEPGTRPGEYPWSRTFEPEIISMDMNRIIDGRFNTIRTWGSLTEDELQLIDSMGLKIIFGIYVDSHGDFGDESFIINTENNVRSILSYSKNYDSIITYLIMNEPLPSDISAAGAAEMVSLFDRLKTIINNEHPGIPVSFSNTCVGEFINMNIFDISAYNLYMYAPATIKNAIGYTGYVEELKNASINNPLIVTEYGLSVSPLGQGNYGYGGNTLTEQMEGDLYMYRSLIDGNAQGGCVFNYLDGWWKNADIPNDADTHEDEPEEWFGLFGIEDANSDPNGTARPVWNAMKAYNACIITSPKNGRIYTGDIPLELFPHSDVKSIRIKRNSNTIYQKSVNNRSYISDSLALGISEQIKDIVLHFEFIDDSNSIIKTEDICFLYAQDPPPLPSLVLSVPIEDLNESTSCPIQITIENSSDFVIKNNRVDYTFYPHLGWDAGVSYSSLLVTNPQTILHTYTIPVQCDVLSVAAGMTIQFGQFEKRIYQQKIIQRGSWANPICRKSIRMVQ